MKLDLLEADHGRQVQAVRRRNARGDQAVQHPEVQEEVLRAVCAGVLQEGAEEQRPKENCTKILESYERERMNE